MENQGKRLILAMGLSFVLMAVWQWLFPPPMPPLPTETQQETVVPSQAVAKPTTGAVLHDEPTKVRPKEETVAFAFDDVHVEMSTYGATLVSWELQEKKSAKEHRNFVAKAAKETQRPLLLSVREANNDDVPLLSQESTWTIIDKQARAITFENKSDQLKITKQITFIPESFLAKVNVNIALSPQVTGKKAVTLGMSLFEKIDPNTADDASLFAPPPLAWRAICSLDGELQESEETTQTHVGAVKWAGFNHNYFLSAIIPERLPRLECDAKPVMEYSRPAENGMTEMRLSYPTIILKPGDPSYERVFYVFLGPKYIETLESIATVIDQTGKTNPQLEESVELGWFAFIARPLLWLLIQFELVVGNWGVAIIMLTIVVMLLTLPWQNKAMRSMRAMSKLRPKIEEIQKKYTDDKQRQQTEIMGLYKNHGINPLAGCLPMFLQMPIWFALYRALSVAAELHHSPFIPGWLDDMTATDPYYVLPVLLTMVMFLQAKMMPTTVESAQQKIMIYGMPLMFGAFSFVFPSGLTLYIFTNTLLRGIHQWWRNNHEDA